MPGCPEHTRPILFLWRFDGDGNPYMDSRLDIKKETPETAVQSAHMMNLRMRFNQCHMSLFHISPEMTLDDVDQYIDSAKFPAMREEIMKKLKDSRINLQDILGTKAPTNSIDFILDLENDGCTCGCKEGE